ncbi:hypothetical protein AYK26_06875 [Euryarchaeota archaeon SM23-78]|nr:MAG: hypothetical protein AYK26_06875 [Euryarchaeota archaeon SM23-78]MBW3000386.1 hypothetical protein [Candidatus Woesearchaeota archaeon]
MPISDLIGIRGTGAYFPRKKVDVKDLAKKYHLNYHKLLEEHGIKRIHVAGSSEDELFMATKAVQQALHDAKIGAKDIDIVIFCKGITRRTTSRTYSSEIIKIIDGNEVYGFDIEGGLIGGLIGIQLANDIIKNNFHINNAVVVASQEFDELYLFGGGASRIKNMIFGDGAAALVLSNDATNNHILASNFLTDHYTGFLEDLLIQSFKSDSKLKQFLGKFKVSAVVKKINKKKVISKMVERSVANSYKVIEFCMKKINLDVTDINHFIKTQLSLKETELLCKRLGISTDKIYNASAEKGHLGHADILCNLHLTLKNPNIKNLDIIAVATANLDCSSGAIILRR